MRTKQSGHLLLLLLNIAMAPSFAQEVADPCVGPAALLALANRPTVADSACVVPFEKGVIEVGGQYQNIKGGGHGYNLPEAELRLGLPEKTELTITLPNYYHQTLVPRAGFSSSIIGLKHELGHTAKWIATIEGLVTLSSRSSSYGNDAMGGTINGILGYNLSNPLSLTMMLGVSSQTLPYSLGGQRYNSINPDIVLTWQLNNKFQTYGEIYGQSKTGPNNGAGFNADAGVQYLLTKNLEADFELGQRISGKLAQFNNYAGLGLAWLF